MRTSAGAGRICFRSVTTSASAFGWTVVTSTWSSLRRFSKAVPDMNATEPETSQSLRTAWVRWAVGFLTAWASSTANRSTEVTLSTRRAKVV